MTSRVFLILSLSLASLVLLTSPPVLKPWIVPTPSPTATASPTTTPTSTPTVTPDPFSHIPIATPLFREPVTLPSLPLPEGSH